MKMIAVVEDNADNRLLIRAILDDRFDVTEYSSGSQALSGLAENKPDLVLMDISLPEMDGVDVLRELRQTEALHDLPVVALTAHAMTGDREKYLSYGFQDYVTKPLVDEQVLLGTIERWVRGVKR